DSEAEGRLCCGYAVNDDMSEINLMPRNASNNNVFGRMASAPDATFGTTTDASGFWGVVRKQGLVSVWKNGELFNSSARTAGTAPNASLWIGAANGTAASRFSTRRISAFAL